MTEEKEITLPSRFQVNDEVTLDFGSAQVPNCVIYAVKFTENNVRYDVGVTIDYGAGNGYDTILKDVESNLVTTNN